MDFKTDVIDQITEIAMRFDHVVLGAFLLGSSYCVMHKQPIKKEKFAAILHIKKDAFDDLWSSGLSSLFIELPEGYWPYSVLCFEPCAPDEA